jgi:hypothetical protein
MYTEQSHIDTLQRLYPELLKDQGSWQRANDMHRWLTSQGLGPSNPTYYAYQKWYLGRGQGERQAAPLTQTEREFCKQTHCDEDAYAVEKARLHGYKSAGYYRRDRG